MNFKKPDESDFELRMKRIRDWLRQFYCHGNEVAKYNCVINKAQEAIIFLNGKRKEGLLDTLSYMIEKVQFKYGYIGIVIVLAAGYELMLKQKGEKYEK